MEYQIFWMNNGQPHKKIGCNFSALLAYASRLVLDGYAEEVIFFEKVEHRFVEMFYVKK